MTMKTAQRNNGNKITTEIKERLKRYRDYMAHADECEQEDVYFGKPQFEEIIDHYELELRKLAKIGLLEELDDDFTNLQKLTATAERIEERIKQERLQHKENKAVEEARTGLNGELHDKQTSDENSGQSSTVTLTAILDDYLKKNDRDNVKWSPKNRDKEQSLFQFLIKAAGDVSVDQFNESHVRLFTDALDKRTKKRRGASVPISGRTKNEYLATCRRVFELAEARYPEIQKNYFANKAIRYKEEETSRLPYTNDELKALFSHSVYTSGEFLHPYQYWTPLLALFTAARANELAQLHVDDFVIEEGIPCLNLTVETPDKSLKNEVSRRLVPLHPTLIDLGFQKFVELLKTREGRWKDENGYYRMFRGLTLDNRNGGYKKNLSRWFNGKFDNKNKKFTGFKHEAGIVMPDNCLKDFHSFRHNCSTALDNAGVPPNIAFKTTGHTLDEATKKIYNSAGGVYRHDLEVKVKYDAICRLNFDEVLSEVKPFFDVGGKKKSLPRRKLR